MPTEEQYRSFFLKKLDEILARNEELEKLNEENAKLIADLQNRVEELEKKAHYKTLAEACKDHALAVSMLPKR